MREILGAGHRRDAERLIRFNELTKVEDRLTPSVIAEVKAMSGATIDRYLAQARAARHPAGSLSCRRPAVRVSCGPPSGAYRDGQVPERARLSI